MTVEQLKEVMKYQLGNFNDEGVAISDTTVHNEVLSDSDGYGQANSKTIYKLVIRRTLIREGHEDRSWPAGWMDLSVEELAPLLL